MSKTRLVTLDPILDEQDPVILVRVAPIPPIEELRFSIRALASLATPSETI